MTAQNNNSSQDFSYPQFSSKSSTVVANPATQQVPVDDAVANVQTPPPAPAANGAEEISGPSFEDGKEEIVDTPKYGVVKKSPVQSSTVVTEKTPEPVVPIPVNEPPVEKAPVQKEVVKEEVKEKINPLQALAEKLNALKSELIEEVPEEKSVEKAAVVEETPEPVIPTPVKEKPIETTNEPIVPAPVKEEPIKIEVVKDVTSNTIETSPLPTLSSEGIKEKINESNEESIKEEIKPVEKIEVKEDMQDPSVSAVNSFGKVSKANIIKDDLSSIMPERETESDVLVVDDTASSEISTMDSKEVEKKEEPVEDLTNTGPDAIQVDPVKEKTPLTSVALGSSGRVKKARSGKYPLSIINLLDMAIQRDASDVHISVGYPVMMRIDGTLIAVHEQIVSEANSEELILPVLSEQKKELLEVNREVDLAYAHQNDDNARFRINAFYTRNNLSAAFRLIPNKIRTIAELGLPKIYHQFARLTQGLVLVTGPTGHGKSTTLAAILQDINTNRAVHLLTIEDPIEYIFPKSKALIDQREMHDDTHSWTIALKSALRQDPDVILVGEMRDFETIAAAITLAETGHLVFATLHTNSASQTIDRIIDVFPENQQAQIRTQLANILEAVIAQRLIPLESGGRRAVSEIMIGVPAIRNLVREGKTHQIDNVIRTGADVGMISLEHSLVKFVRDGIITMEKAQKYAVHPEEVVRLLKN